MVYTFAEYLENDGICLRCECNFGDGYFKDSLATEDIWCGYFESVSPKKIVNCMDCRRGNAWGKHGCPICYTVHGEEEEEERSEEW